MNFKSLHTADFESKTHYKMYKDGKQWMFAGIMAIALGAGIVAPSQQASADTTDAATVATTTNTGTSSTNSNTVTLSTSTSTTTTPTTDAATTSADTAVTPVATAATVSATSQSTGATPVSTASATPAPSETASTAASNTLTSNAVGAGDSANSAIKSATSGSTADGTGTLGSYGNKDAYPSISGNSATSSINNQGAVTVNKSASISSSNSFDVNMSKAASTSATANTSSVAVTIKAPSNATVGNIKYTVDSAGNTVAVTPGGSSYIVNQMGSGVTSDFMSQATSTIKSEFAVASNNSVAAVSAKNAAISYNNLATSNKAQQQSQLASAKTAGDAATSTSLAVANRLSNFASSLNTGTGSFASESAALSKAASYVKAGNWTSAATQLSYATSYAYGFISNDANFSSLASLKDSFTGLKGWATGNITNSDYTAYNNYVATSTSASAAASNYASVAAVNLLASQSAQTDYNSYSAAAVAAAKSAADLVTSARSIAAGLNTSSAVIIHNSYSGANTSVTQSYASAANKAASSVTSMLNKSMASLSNGFAFNVPDASVAGLFWVSAGTANDSIRLSFASSVGNYARSNAAKNTGKLASMFNSLASYMDYLQTASGSAALAQTQMSQNSGTWNSAANFFFGGVVPGMSYSADDLTSAYAALSDAMANLNDITNSYTVAADLTKSGSNYVTKSYGTTYNAALVDQLRSALTNQVKVVNGLVDDINQYVVTTIPDFVSNYFGYQLLNTKDSGDYRDLAGMSGTWQAVQDSAAMIVDQLAYQQASDYASLYASIANSYRALGTNAGNSLLGSLYDAMASAQNSAYSAMKSAYNSQSAEFNSLSLAGALNFGVFNAVPGLITLGITNGTKVVGSQLASNIQVMMKQMNTGMQAMTDSYASLFNATSAAAVTDVHYGVVAQTPATSGLTGGTFIDNNYTTTATVNGTDNTTTTDVVYQVVDEGVLTSLAATTSTDSATATAIAAAKSVLANSNVSQRDVDSAVNAIWLALDHTIAPSTTAGKTGSAAVSAAATATAPISLTSAAQTVTTTTDLNNAGEKKTFTVTGSANYMKPTSVLLVDSQGNTVTDYTSSATYNSQTGQFSLNQVVLPTQGDYKLVVVWTAQPDKTDINSYNGKSTINLATSWTNLDKTAGSSAETVNVQRTLAVKVSLQLQYTDATGTVHTTNLANGLLIGTGTVIVNDPQLGAYVGMTADQILSLDKTAGTTNSILPAGYHLSVNSNGTLLITVNGTAIDNGSYKIDADNATNDALTLVLHADANTQNARVVVQGGKYPTSVSQGSAVGLTGSSIVFNTNDTTLKMSGATYTVTGPDGKTYASFRDALAANSTFDATNWTDDTGSDKTRQIFTVNYVFNKQIAQLQVGAPNAGLSEQVTGDTDSDIAFKASDADLKKAGFTYTVTAPDGIVYASLAAALAATMTVNGSLVKVGKFDETDFAVGVTDPSQQIFKVTYTPDAQSATVVANKNGVNSTLETITGKTSDKLASTTVSDATLATPGYTYTVVGPDGVTYASLAEAVAANGSFDNTDNAGTADESVQTFTVNYVKTTQHATITIHDKSTGKVLGTVTISGKSGDVITADQLATAISSVTDAQPNYAGNITITSDTALGQNFDFNDGTD
ncbi:KxYKxGKxW signal peptide domain-containing protein [Weissella cibaria]|uniref:KxYKxGKxW signal peptide domain-containing protein n=1 Tax=Weissella cibaria TaxID=137591 RepID=UPI001E3F0BF1|nr:KxYKxGKxW signal peptide domain-containing protein [Weissella cibaria]MCC6122241.1 KxYKxGKxW signal peptide domain-containing protein [Weissella cibaria]